MIFSCLHIFLTGNSLLTYFQGHHWAYCDHDLISKVSSGLRMVNFRQSELASETRRILPIEFYQMFFSFFFFFKLNGYIIEVSQTDYKILVPLPPFQGHIA